MGKDIYILNIETATKNCSVSIAKNGKLVVIKELCEQNYSHAEKLMPFINSCLNKAAIDFNNLNAVAIGKGPGSFTGLRIGVSTAKGLCYALDIPLISVDTLEILANAITIKKGFIIPLLDARRKEVYTAVFDASKKWIKETYNHVLETNSFKEYLNKDKVFFLGDATTKTKEIIAHNNAVFYDDIHPSTNEMCILTYQKYVNNDIEDVAYFEPFYLKDFYVGPK